VASGECEPLFRDVRDRSPLKLKTFRLLDAQRMRQNVPQYPIFCKLATQAPNVTDPLNPLPPKNSLDLHQSQEQPPRIWTTVDGDITCEKSGNPATADEVSHCSPLTQRSFANCLYAYRTTRRQRLFKKSWNYYTFVVQ